MLAFHPLDQQPADPERHASLLREFRDLLTRDGMADMEEYGDMLKWGLPSRDGWCRYFHVFDPGFCSFSDQFFGTIHFHGGVIRGTVLLGKMEHSVYEATAHEDGDRFHDETAYTLTQHPRLQPAGTEYALQPFVPHWTKPTTLSLTYFEEEDNGVMGDLVNPATKETDEHAWEQADADALVPRLLALIDEALATLEVPA